MDEKQELALIDLIRELELIEHQHKNEIFRGFNIFVAAGLVRQEIRHSTILASLLNPLENHGLGDALAKKIINYATEIAKNESKPNQLKTALANFDDLIVNTEVGYDKNRIDILAHSDKNKLVVVIENKVDSTEGNAQLKTYTAKINQDKTYDSYKKLFIYLTIEGEDASEEDWVPLSYKTILDYLEDIASRVGETLSSETNIFIKHYIDLVRRNIMGEITQELRNACIDIYKRHKTTIDLIYKNLQTPTLEAQESFSTAMGSEIINLYSNKRQLVFLPKALSQIPDTVGTEWNNTHKPIVIWFAFSDQSLGLVIEVGPMADIDLRAKFVQALYDVLDVKRQSAGQTFSRVWRQNRKMDLDQMSPEEIVDAMNSLYNKLSGEGLINKIQTAALKTWPEISFDQQ